MGLLMGSTFPHLTPGMHWQEAAPSQFSTHAMSCPHSSLSIPSLQFLTGVLVKALSQAQDGDIWRAGGGGICRWSSNSQHGFQTAAHTIPFPTREGLEGSRGRDAYCLEEIRGWGLPVN